MNKLKYLIIILLLLSLNINAQELLKYKECNNPKISNDYYTGVILALTFNNPDYKVPAAIETYSKKIDKNICMYYLNPTDLNLDIDLSQLIIFSDNKKYIYNSILDVTNGTNLNKYYKAKLYKYNFDYKDGIYFNKVNNSKHNIALFLNLECPYSSDFYKLFYKLYNNNKNNFKDINVILYLYDYNLNNLKPIISHALKNNLLESSSEDFNKLLYNYYSISSLSSSDLNKIFNVKYDNENKVNEYINKISSIYKSMNIKGTPGILINSIFIEEEDLGILNKIFKEELNLDLNKELRR